MMIVQVVYILGASTWIAAGVLWLLSLRRMRRRFFLRMAELDTLIAGLTTARAACPCHICTARRAQEEKAAVLQ